MLKVKRVSPLVCLSASALSFFVWLSARAREKKAQARTPTEAALCVAVVRKFYAKLSTQTDATRRKARG